MENRKRFFHSMRQQLVNEVMFVRNVSRPYRDAPNDLHIVDFEYSGAPCKLILNGTLSLQTKRETIEVESFNDLIKGLIRSKYKAKNVA